MSENAQQGENPKTNENPAEETQPKAELTAEEKQAKLGRLKRQQSKLEKELGIEKKVENGTDGKSSGLDYGQKAFLIANEIKGKKEQELAQEIMKETGKSLDDVVESKYFKAELKEIREAEATDKATPKGSKKAGTPASSTAEYWVKKGALPPNTPANSQLRREVVNARLKVEQNTSRFTSNPVIK